MASVRRIFPYLLAVLVLAAVGWAVSFGTLPPADFTFINGTEVQSIDPAIVTGVPEGRIINGIFEGLYRPMPDPDEPTNLRPTPAIAESCDISADGKTYTFHIRESARWSNGDPITADDFVWSWLRFLHPEVPNQYAYQLHYIVGARKYNYGTKELEIGDRVEIELADRVKDEQLFPRGTILAGVLTAIEKPPEPTLDDGASDDDRKEADAAWKKRWVFEVDVKPSPDGDVSWNAPGKVQRFSKDKDVAATTCKHVLYHFGEVGVDAPDKRTLVVELNAPTPYFLHLAAFYPCYPVNRKCVEEHGSPNWTKPENIVCSGPFVPEFRRIRDRIRLRRNPKYWDAERVELETIDALAVESQVTQLNMYMNGQADWATDIPTTIISEVKDRDDFLSEPQLATYFYRLNVTADNAPLDDARVEKR